MEMANRIPAPSVPLRISHAQKSISPQRKSLLYFPTMLSGLEQEQLRLHKVFVFGVSSGGGWWGKGGGARGVFRQSAGDHKGKTAKKKKKKENAGSPLLAVTIACCRPP